MILTIEGVCNQALDLIGYPRHIGNIYEGSRAGRLALDSWGETRDLALSTTQPSWARADAPLTLLRSAPEFGYDAGTPWTSAYPPIPWLYEYDTPDDCIVPLALKPQLYLPIYRPRFIPFRSQNDAASDYTILTNINPAIMTYIKRVLDPNQWDLDFVELMVHGLAKRFQAGIGKAQAQPQPQQRERQDANAA